MQFVKLKHASVSICGAETCSVLAELVQSCELLEDPSWIDLELAREVDGLHLTWNRALEKPLKFHLDFEKLVRHQRNKVRLTRLWARRLSRSLMLPAVGPVMRC